MADPKIAGVTTSLVEAKNWEATSSSNGERSEQEVYPASQCAV